MAGGINVYQYAPNTTGWIDPLGLAAVSNTSDFDTARRDIEEHFPVIRPLTIAGVSPVMRHEMAPYLLLQWRSAVLSARRRRRGMKRAGGVLIWKPARTVVPLHEESAAAVETTSTSKGETP